MLKSIESCLFSFLLHIFWGDSNRMCVNSMTPARHIVQDRKYLTQATVKRAE